ncbi:SDR family oxidoreductase [Archangium minus]|uniref:SDR family oxidoreductase n=1 Tax=Archangium minus TaxID=83450 RepID=A0ABY9XCC5_9BACT|nr:SDR family oxidoreductase [Archangium minus]
MVRVEREDLVRPVGKQLNEPAVIQILACVELEQLRAALPPEAGRENRACVGLMVLDPIAEFSLSDFDKVHRTNVRGTFVVTQQAARRVRSGGAIINLSTSAERQALPTYGVYAASKGAVEAMSQLLTREQRGRAISAVILLRPTLMALAHIAALRSFPSQCI